MRLPAQLQLPAPAVAGQAAGLALSTLLCLNLNGPLPVLPAFADEVLLRGSAALHWLTHGSTASCAGDLQVPADRPQQEGPLPVYVFRDGTGQRGARLSV